MYDWAKEKDDLVEVIYACMDGYVYFLDLKPRRGYQRSPLPWFHLQRSRCT